VKRAVSNSRQAKTSMWPKPAIIRCTVERAFPYPISHLYAVVANIDAYPLYMPGWRVVRVLERSATRLKVKQTVGTMGLWATFVSNVVADPPHRLEIRSKGPPFRRFCLRWLFRKQSADVTLVRVELEATFHSPLTERLVAGLMPIMLNRIIEAFRRRAASPSGHVAGHRRSSALPRGRPKRRRLLTRKAVRG
jgi:coenzyme Q-binding protein COQ10